MKRFLLHEQLEKILSDEEIDSIIKARRKKNIWVWVAIALIAINVVWPTAISFALGIVFFCALCGTGYLFKDDEKLNELEKKITEEKDGLFIACYLTFFIPGIYMLFHTTPSAGIANIKVFVISVIAFVVLWIVMVKIVLRNGGFRIKDKEGNLLEVLIIAAIWFVYLLTAFICLNYLFDTNYKEREVAVELEYEGGSGFNWQDYVFYDEENEAQETTNDYFFFSEVYETAIVREGDGAFGLAYKNVFIEGIEVDEDYWDEYE